MVRASAGASSTPWDIAVRRLPPDGAVVEAAIRSILARNGRLVDSRITAVAGAEGVVVLTGWVPTQELRREVEVSCWTVDGVRSLHDHLVVGRGAAGTRRRS